MGFANKNQVIQDWITQQWVILFGKRIDKLKYKWLLGPLGNTNGIGYKFIKQLAEDEELIIDDNNLGKGLIDSIDQLNLSKEKVDELSPDVIEFYENTSDYNLKLAVNWNPIFKGVGYLVRIIFSNRIDQLNIPINNPKSSSGLTSEIIKLIDLKTGLVIRTIWLRAFKATGQVVYSGVYEVCTIPSGKNCIKAIFPLPNGNATVILEPRVGSNGELILESAGKAIGDSGFYFLLEDSQGQTWTKFIRSFRDRLVVRSENERVTAIQTLTLWNLRVLEFKYEIEKFTQNN